MGSGKTTIGSLLAAALRCAFVDNDIELRRVTGLTAAELAARDGAGALHAAEADAVLGALRAPGLSVIAAAASAITSPAVREALARDAFVVWIRTDPATLAARLPHSTTRPFSSEDPATLVARQARERDPLFEHAADLVEESHARSPEEVVATILVRLRDPRGSEPSDQ